MNYRRITYIAIIILFIAFSVYVFLYERHVSNEAQSRVDEHALIVADALWAYNPQDISQYLTLACISHDYEDIVVTDTSGQVFYAAVGKEPGGFERLLMSLNLIPSVRLVSDVVYQGEKIGQIEVTWNSKTIYVHARVLFALVMILVVLHLYIRTLHSRNELREAQEELVRKEKQAVLGQLAGGVGHELRNPLGAIKNAAYFLNMAVEKPETEVKESLDILTKEVAASEHIISSLLGFARPKSPTLRKMDINEVVQEALSQNAVPENVKVVTQLNESLPTIMADPEQLGQVFGNIMLNAIQAMPEGGQLVVKSEVPSSGWVAASFTDTGAGIPKENLGKLFEPLFSTKAKGIGLGLALSKTLVEGHGGTIEVESEEGKGSTFTVRLPVGTEEEK